MKNITRQKVGSIGDMSKVLEGTKEHPAPVRISGRAELWVMPSRSTIDTARFIVVFRIGKKVYTNCSCPAGTQVPPKTCYHAVAVARERMRLINAKERQRVDKMLSGLSEALKKEKKRGRKKRLLSKA